MMDYCCDNYWVPNCDTCGDVGCHDCDGGAKSNHDCSRWAQREVQDFSQELEVPW